MSEKPIRVASRRFPHLPEKGLRIVTWDNIDRSKLPNFNAVAELPMRAGSQGGADATDSEPPKD